MYLEKPSILFQKRKYFGKNKLKAAHKKYYL